jgi:hypothetical protein
LPEILNFPPFEKAEPCLRRLAQASVLCEFRALVRWSESTMLPNFSRYLLAPVCVLDHCSDPRQRFRLRANKKVALNHPQDHFFRRNF